MIIGGVCKSALLDFLTGVHTPDDDYHMVLLGRDADANPALVVFSGEGEAKGQGYAAGGKKLTGYRSGLEEGVAWLAWDNVEWYNATVKAYGALIVNKSRGNRVLAVLDFGGEQSSSQGLFRVKMPNPGQHGAVIWLA